MAEKTTSGEVFDDLFRMTAKDFAEKYGVTKDYAKHKKSKVKKRILRRMERASSDPNYELTPEHLEEVKRLQELLQEFKDAGLPVSPEDWSRVQGWKVWEMGVKDADGNIQTEVMRSAQFAPNNEDLRDSLIRVAPPVIITPAKIDRAPTKDRRAIIVPDLQGGYRRHGETLEPIHDENVVNVGLQIIRHSQPDLIILNGDNLDFPDMTRFDKDSDHFVQVMQPTVDRVSELLAQMRSNAPDARIIWLAGNHEYRLNRAILKHNSNLWGIKRPGEEHAWLSVAHLMRLDDMGVEYVSGYPSNAFQINDRLQAIHGTKVRSAGSTAALYAKEEEISTIFGHVHRHESHTRTNRLGKQITAMSFGTWARIDGAVPSYHNAVTDEGDVVPRIENWSQGLGFVEYMEGDNPFQEHHVRINPEDGYEVSFDNQKFRPTVEE